MNANDGVMKRAVDFFFFFFSSYRVSARCDQGSVEKDSELLEPAGGERSCPQWCGRLLKQLKSFILSSDGT